MIYKRITDIKTLNAYKKLAKKIIIEHTSMTLPFDRSFHYLWSLWHNKVENKLRAFQHETEVLADFILFSEMNLLRETDFLHQEGFNNLIEMLSSQDQDNLFIAIKSIEHLRTERIKKYGQFSSDIEKVSPIMLELAKDYGSKIMTSHMKYFKHKKIYNNKEK